MEDRLTSLRMSIEDALDELSSPRTSSEAKTDALRSLEKILASSCVPRHFTDDLDHFLALQYTFECNVPSRILSWIALSTLKIDILTSKTNDAEPDSEIVTLTSQLALSLSIVQGVCLTHAATKTFLGRKCALEVLLDLFLCSRHLSSTPSSTDNLSGSPLKLSAAPAPPLASIILDTLLCILVDSSPALRAFEACQGVHAVVKILKRAGTPREVRMKCLEFLYFYLLDETSSSVSVATPTPTLTAPSTPIQPATAKNKKPSLNATPARPISRYGSSTFSLTSSSFASSGSSSFVSTSDSSASSSSASSRSTSGSSASSFSSTSSNAGSTSPKKHSQMLPGADRMHTPTPTPRPKQTPRPLQPRALMMLRKDVDFVPLSPKKPASDENGTPAERTRTRSRLASSSDEEGSGSGSTTLQDSQESTLQLAVDENDERTRTRILGGGSVNAHAKTTEEKKELLATMLGNVEALVEGVRKAGVWGLG